MKKLSNLLIRPLLRLSGESQRLDFLAEFERTQYLSREELTALQAMRLRKLLKHAQKSCSYYRQIFTEVGFDPDSFPDNPIDISKIPPLGKTEIQNNFDGLRSDSLLESDVSVNQTGGSTGQPIRFLVDSQRFESRVAASLRHDRWAGLEYGRRRAVIWGAPQDNSRKGLKSRVRRKILGDALWLDTGKLTEQRMLEFHTELFRFKPTVFVAYANAMTLLATFYKTRRIRPYSPKSIITSAEVLTSEGRRVIEEVFQAPVFNRYGCREMSVIASECEMHSGLHTMSEGLYIEIVRNEKPVVPGELGEILITDLLNRAMPLIRYRIGDLGTWAAGNCPCGRVLPRLEHLEGRVTDFVVGEDGRLVSGVFIATYVLAQRPSLGRVQLIQTEPGKVVYRIEPGTGFQKESDLQYLATATRNHLGNNTEIEFEIVERLPTEPSGKFRYCKSTVNPHSAFQLQAP